MVWFWVGLFVGVLLTLAVVVGWAFYEYNRATKRF